MVEAIWPFKDVDAHFMPSCHAFYLPKDLRKFYMNKRIFDYSSGDLLEVERNFKRYGDDNVQATQPNIQACPFCQASLISGIELFPLALDELDRAVDLRRSEASGKKGRRPSFDETQAEVSYLALSHSQSGSSKDSDNLRIGRWTDAEMAYVDFLLLAFEQRKLVIPNGMRLNDFLCEVLLCKPSRLTKKMKNMKLSARSYNAAVPRAMVELDYAEMSKLEHLFLESISSEASRVELSFHMTKAWRGFFSNFCLQIGSSLLDAQQWISSLEDMERRAAEAEERLRQARRKRMGIALKADVRVGAPGVFFAGMPVLKRHSSQALSSQASTHNNSQATLGESSDVTSEDGSEADFISNMLDLGGLVAPGHSRSNSVDFHSIFENEHKMAAFPEIPAASLVKKNCGPFLERIISFVEMTDLPFEHVDVWVPTYVKDGLRLCHAGFVTRQDLDTGLYHRLNEYGDYSTKFSFAPGVGLPGRVYQSNAASWECRVDQKDARIFERAGGAKVYGVKTGLGIAVKTNVIGTIVVALYSTSELSENPSIIEQCTTEFNKLSPSPKWKLVVEMDDDQDTETGKALPENPPGELKYESGYHPGKSIDSRGTLVEALDPSDEENMIASLLGEHIPLSATPGSGASQGSDLIPHFMSLRLLLLRDALNRSPSENEMLEIMKKSYRGYSTDQRRSPKDLAFLLARDWQFLRASLPSVLSTTSLSSDSKPAGEYKSHTLKPPVRTHSMTGVPTLAPGPLSYVDPSNVRRGSDAAGGVPASPTAKRPRFGSLEDEIGPPFF